MLEQKFVGASAFLKIKQTTTNIFRQQKQEFPFWPLKIKQEEHLTAPTLIKFSKIWIQFNGLNALITFPA